MKNELMYVSPVTRLLTGLTRFILLSIVLIFAYDTVSSAQLKAGVAKVNITNVSAKKINDSLYVKALVLDNGNTKAVIISLDVIAVGGIGSISNDFLNNVRSRVQQSLNISHSNILINATHLHWTEEGICPEVEERTFQAVKEAWQNRVPVTVGIGSGYEDRIMENRRLKLTNGKEWTIRHANPLPPDNEVAGSGPVDPEIGILRLDRKDGRTLAVVYNFACHPYTGVPSKAVTGDFPSFASKVIEGSLSNGTIAIFLQGFGGDITPILYKDVNNPRDAEKLGNMLGLSILNTLHEMECKKSQELKVINEIITLPRRSDIPKRIESLVQEQETLLQSLRGTSLNLKTFIPLYIKYNLSREYPSYYSHRYANDKMTGRADLENLDAENTRNIDKYMSNIYAMEKLARIQENMYFLKTRQGENDASGEKTIKVEIQAMKIGDFVLVTFPGEVSVEVGLNIKKSSPYKFTYLAGYSNGYIHYAPTAEQFKGEAYEDSNCLLGPEWQQLFEQKVIEILNRL